MQNFENFLKEKHAEDYIGTDDYMADDFETFLENIDKEEMLQLADEWTKNVLEFAQLRVKQIKGVYSAHDALEKVDETLTNLLK